MYLIAIAWMYVVTIVAVADTTIVGGVLTFIFWGVAPLSLFLWLFGTPARRRRQAARAALEATKENDSAETSPEQ